MPYSLSVRVSTRTTDLGRVARREHHKYALACEYLPSVPRLDCLESSCVRRGRCGTPRIASLLPLFRQQIIPRTPFMNVGTAGSRCHRPFEPHRYHLAFELGDRSDHQPPEISSISKSALEAACSRRLLPPTLAILKPLSASLFQMSPHIAHRSRLATTTTRRAWRRQHRPDQVARSRSLGRQRARMGCSSQLPQHDSTPRNDTVPQYHRNLFANG